MAGGVCGSDWQTDDPLVADAPAQLVCYPFRKIFAASGDSGGDVDPRPIFRRPAGLHPSPFAEMKRGKFTEVRNSIYQSASLAHEFYKFAHSFIEWQKFQDTLGFAVYV
jgi:hypothetical protein